MSLLTDATIIPPIVGIETFGSNQTLKNYNSKTISFNDMTMYVQNATWSKMYKRSMFNITANLEGINQQFASCTAPNIFDVSITLNADGLKFGPNGLFQKDEFYNIIANRFSVNVINKILSPRDMILIGSTVSSDEDGETTLVNDNGYIEVYNNTSYNLSNTYRVYFPRVTRGGSGDTEINQQNATSVKTILNWQKLYSISISCQDKLYTLKATSLS